MQNVTGNVSPYVFKTVYVLVQAPAGDPAQPAHTESWGDRSPVPSFGIPVSMCKRRLS